MMVFCFLFSVKDKFSQFENVRVNSMQKDDGDIIRGLGFVTLYSAYLEEHIDALLSLLGPVEKFGEDK